MNEHPTARHHGEIGEVLDARVPQEAAGERLDKVLAGLFPAHSRSRLTRWIREGAVELDGRSARPRDAVRGGEQVRLRVPRQCATPDAAQEIALELLHEDADLFVVNKPPGLVVHPGAGNPVGTLVNALLHRDPGLSSLPRAGIVHRLDKDTSGAMIVARSLRAHTALVAQLAARAIHRQYEAVVNGILVAGGRIEAPLDRHPVDRLRRAVVQGGRPAVTHYRVRARFRAHTHVECRLETGRTHQIRVHLAHIRHPILGDPLYGGGLRLPRGAGATLIETLSAFRRQALHAERIAFSHPVSGASIDLTAPRPPDLELLLRVLRADAECEA